LRDDEEPCFTEADFYRWGILPVPDWARKPPRPKRKERRLFDDAESADEE